MIKRPKGTDTEQDIFQMQKEFLMEKKKGSNFQPAAKVVKLSKRELIYTQLYISTYRW